MKEYIERAALKRELAPYEENDFSQQINVILAIVDAMKRLVRKTERKPPA